MTRTRMPRDPNQRAKRVVDIATGQLDPEPMPAKDPAAIARGKLGGVIGGARRAANMTPEQRSESARKAAVARWQKERSA